MTDYVATNGGATRKNACATCTMKGEMQNRGKKIARGTKQADTSDLSDGQLQQVSGGETELREDQLSQTSLETAGDELTTEDETSEAHTQKIHKLAHIYGELH